MRTLEQEIAFNEGYRRQWQDYMAELNAQAVAERLEGLVRGMDFYSVDVCRRHIELIPFFMPHAISRHLFMAESSKRHLLSAKVVETLDSIGFFTRRAELLDKIHRELDLPEQPLAELITHSGLAFILKEARQRIPGSTVIDGGAYIGDTAKLIHKYYQPASILAIEPEEKTYTRMCEAVESWGLREQITPLRNLLSDEHGTEILWGEGVGASVIPKLRVKNEVKAAITKTTIDRIVKERNLTNVSLIKLDVEGSEYAAIVGALETIRTHRPILIVSIYHTARDFFEIKPLLEARIEGYRYMVRKLTDDLMKEVVLIGVPISDVGN